MSRSKPTKMRRGSLVFIAALLIGSAAVRAGFLAGEAIAAEPSRQLPEASANAPVAPEPGVLLQAIKEREAFLDQWQRDLQDHARALEIADAEIDRKLAELVEAEAALRATVAMADGAAEQDISRLTTVYENMKPKDAAALFEEMPPEFAAGFLGRMRPEAAAEVMAGMAPETSFAISVVMAGRNANAPTE